MYALTVTDSTGTLVPHFDPQLVLTINPTDAEIGVAVLDPDTNIFKAVDATLLDDGALSFSVEAVAQVPEPQAS